MTGTAKKNKTRAPAPAKVSIAQAVRDVIITSINRGQFPFVLLGCIAVILTIKIPESEVVPLINSTFNQLSELSLIGYVLWVLTVFLWYFHAQRVRRELSGELEALRLALKQQRREK